MADTAMMVPSQIVRLVLGMRIITTIQPNTNSSIDITRSSDM